MKETPLPTFPCLRLQMKHRCMNGPWQVHSPTSKVQCPMSRVHNLERKVEKPKTKVQRPKIKVQRPTFRTTTMPYSNCWLPQTSLPNNLSTGNTIIWSELIPPCCREQMPRS